MRALVPALLLAGCQGREPVELDRSPAAMCDDVVEAACRSCNDGCRTTSLDECRAALRPAPCETATGVVEKAYVECMRAALRYECGDPLPIQCDGAFL